MRSIGQKPTTMLASCSSLTLDSKQYHEVKEETLYVLSGVLTNYDEHGTPWKILPGESFHVKPGQVHRFAADSCSVEVIEVSTPHLDDVIRLEDDYSRE